METKDGFVLDCSVTMTWCFDDEATPYTDAVRDSLVGPPGLGAFSLVHWKLPMPRSWANAANDLTRLRSHRFLSRCSRDCRSSSTMKPAAGRSATSCTWPEHITSPPTMPPILSWRSDVACRLPASMAS